VVGGRRRAAVASSEATENLEQAATTWSLAVAADDVEAWLRQRGGGGRDSRGVASQ
jgi:hypothetical protein